jgi:hypothetical protein
MRLRFQASQFVLGRCAANVELDGTQSLAPFGHKHARNHGFYVFFFLDVVPRLNKNQCRKPSKFTFTRGFNHGYNVTFPAKKNNVSQRAA